MGAVVREKETPDSLVRSVELAVSGKTRRFSKRKRT